MLENGHPAKQPGFYQETVFRGKHQIPYKLPTVKSKLGGK
jgi:hypothetical protein